MKYLKKFQNHTQYETYINGEDAILPNVSLCVQQNEVHYNPTYDYSQDYLTFVALENGTFKLSGNSVSYSLDNGETWTTLPANTESPTVTAGNKIMWKGELTSQSMGMGVGNFISTGRFNVKGNAMSLLYGDNYEGQTDLTGTDSIFRFLFSGNTNVINAENFSLPATTLAEQCYSEMFEDCSNLRTAPKLPATTLENWCYPSMFMRCTNLITAPELPATALTNGCYADMFRGCTSLTTAPELPAETLAESCYISMFAYCTNLTSAPELPATTLEYRCYESMFQGCTSLTTVQSVLPATTLEEMCYDSMFRDCANITTAPVLPATTLVSDCYDSMFRGCTKLNYIKAMFTTYPTDSYTDNWVEDVAATGTFVKNSAAQWDVSGDNGIPNGWTVETASE